MLHRQGMADSRARTVIYALSPGGTRLRPLSFLFFFSPFFFGSLGEEGLFLSVFLLQIFPGQ